MSGANYNPVFTLKNFRSFGKEGADFELAPITVLTGRNSAGKSSLVKALLIQEQVARAISGSDPFRAKKFHLSDDELKLGTFNGLINKKAADDKIYISYITHSYLLSEDVKVTLVYIEDTGNVVGNGTLSKVVIERKDGTIIFSEDNLQNNNMDDDNQESTSVYNDYLCIANNFKRFAAFGIYAKALEKGKLSENDYTVSSKEAETLKNNYRKAKEYKEKYDITKEESFDYLYSKHLDILPEFDCVSRWIEEGTFFYYLPIFSEMEGKPQNHLRQYLLNEIEKGEWGGKKEKICDWVHHFSDVFESSGRKSFREFFLSMEQIALAKWQTDPECGWGFYSGNPISVFLDFDKGITRELTEDEKKEHYRLTREQFDNGWSFMAMVAVLEDITLFRGSERVFTKNDSSPLAPNNRWAMKKCLEEYFSLLMVESLTPQFLQRVKYVNSSSVAIKRLYSVEDNEKFSLCLGQYLDGNKQQFDYEIETPKIRKMKKEYKKGDFLNYWVSRFEIGKKIIIKGTDEGLGVLIYIEKEDGETRLLADEGYGISQLVALLLQIEVQILNATIRQVSGGFDGIIFPPAYEQSAIFVEEPEVHLHPRFQSLLADMFVEAYQNYNIHFIIETHSEYLVRRLQVMVADKETALLPDNVSINYIDKDESGLSHNRQIKIQEDGRLSEPFGPGFFNEADSLAMEILKYTARRK